MVPTSQAPLGVGQGDQGASRRQNILSDKDINERHGNGGTGDGGGLNVRLRSAVH
jgi:hypothetical protein